MARAGIAIRTLDAFRPGKNHTIKEICTRANFERLDNGSIRSEMDLSPLVFGKPNLVEVGSTGNESKVLGTIQVDIWEPAQFDEELERHYVVKPSFFERVLNERNSTKKGAFVSCTTLR